MFIFACFPHSSVGKESTCNSGDPGSIPGSGRSPGEGIGYPLSFHCGSVGKESTYNAGDLGLGRSPREERLSTPVFWPGEFHGLFSHGVAKSWTQLSDFHFHLFCQLDKEYTCNGWLYVLTALSHAMPRYLAKYYFWVCVCFQRSLAFELVI